MKRRSMKIERKRERERERGKKDHKQKGYGERNAARLVMPKRKFV